MSSKSFLQSEGIAYDKANVVMLNKNSIKINSLIYDNALRTIGAQTTIIGRELISDKAGIIYTGQSSINAISKLNDRARILIGGRTYIINQCVVTDIAGIRKFSTTNISLIGKIFSEPTASVVVYDIITQTLYINQSPDFIKYIERESEMNRYIEQSLQFSLER